MTVRHPAPAALLAALSLVACGGDSSVAPSLPAPEGGQDGSSPAVGDDFNGPLSGTLLIDRRPLDLATGVRGDAIVPDSRDGNRGVSAAADGRTFYYTEPDCRDRPDRAFLTYDCVVLVDPAGNEIGRLDPGLDLTTNAPDVSPDGRFLAVSSTEIHDAARTVILGADGEILDDAERATLESRVDWAPDGTLYYAADDAVYRARVGEARARDEQVHRFDAPGAFVQSLAISPDGARLAVEIDTGDGSTEPRAAVWLVGTDGGDPHEFATATFIRTVRHPLWSPDGRWLLVSAGGATLSTGAPSPAENLAGKLIALDAGTRTHVIDDLGPDDATTRRLILSSCARDRPCELGSQFVDAWIP